MAEVPRIFLDTCCFSRLGDDRSQFRIRQEMRAMESLFDLKAAGKVRLITAFPVYLEVARTKNEKRREATMSLLEYCDFVPVDVDILDMHVRALDDYGLSQPDKVQLICASLAGADVFLTCDDKLLRRGSVVDAALKILVANPANWIQQFPGGSYGDTQHT